jgi:hypothetical protein
MLKHPSWRQHHPPQFLVLAARRQIEPAQLRLL